MHEHPDEEIVRCGWPTRRPSAAESLLARVKEEGRARLRVYIGAAPGVGKSYRMLEDAHELKRQGVDVVIGFIEPHGRADTLALIGDLEQVPLRQIEYRGVTLKEMDVEAIMARQPQIAVVDELAHTNAPGSTHQKRYEDVLELLDARHQRHHRGQHPAHRVAERRHRVDHRRAGARDVPDWVLKRADEVVNVDVSVETLRERLRQGKIYDAAKIEQALNNFFRKGNLTALRELALRQLATDQAGKAQEYREREGLERPVIPEKVMVAMASRGSAKTLLRVGSRIAGRLATDWYAVYVETPREEPGRIKPADHVALADNIRFAKQLGAKVVKLKSSRVADALVEFAKREGITHVIFGQSARSRWDLLMHGSIVDRFLRDVRNATVQIVPVRRRRRAPRKTRSTGKRHEAADQAPARVRRLRAGAGRARRLERPDAQPDERGVGPDHLRELRFGRRRAGHEGEPRAAGLRRAVRSARRSAIARAARSPSTARASMPRSTRPRRTSPNVGEPESDRGHPPRIATSTTAASTRS